jgi:hypothetical protein
MIFSQEAVYRLDSLSFTEEARFHLNGYINGQNSIIWSSEKPTSTAGKSYAFFKSASNV